MVNCLYPLVLQGGADQKMPIIVSRVAPGTSVSSSCWFPLNESNGTSSAYQPHCLLHIRPHLQADLCVPRLNEGDQVVLINGRDISDHTHDQVVMFIKASCESHSGELILLVRPNGESASVTGG